MINWDDFDKIWARTSPLTPYQFSDSNYEQGWNFVGATPPSRQMWDYIQKQNDEKFKYLRDNFGTPNMVTSSSQMTDTNKVYVYMGSEAGWNSGHWYYYDEGTSSWADGGVYNSVAFVTDTTLSIAGQPADAKATGDALALKSDLAGCTFTGDVVVNADFSVTGDSTLADTTVDDLVVNNDLSVAGDSSLTNLSVSGTTALAGTSTAPTPSADDNSTKIATTEYVQTEIKPIEADVSVNDKRISNVEKLLQGNLYDYQTDSTSAYTKTVSQGAMPYASLDEVGGKTLVWNQWWKVSTNSTITDSSGVTIQRNVANDSLTITGTATTSKTIFSVINTIVGTTNNKLVAEHKYAVVFVSQNIGVRLGYEDTSANHKSSYIITGTGRDYSKALGIVVEEGVTYNETIRPMLCDLTIMFGSGNEPTINEFRAMFPAEYYEATVGTMLSAGVTEVVSKKADTTTLETYPIPAEIQALEGYGWSAGSVYNYIDYERKKFVQNVRGVELGSLHWEKFEYGGKTIFCLRNFFLDPFFLNLPTNNEKANIVCKDYITISYSEYGSGGVGIFAGEIEVGEDFPIYGFGVYDTKIQGMSLADFKASLNGSYLYYELATPQEIDISAYLTDDNLIEVEAGGTLTFPNSNGTDYQIPVPSAETYMIDLQASL